jgi:molybdopterin-guanine dinucleotide biosynthesis protein
MALVVVGGHTRNIGKTTLAAQIIAAFPQLAWTAMKITQYGHGVCSANGEPCDCATAGHAIAISEERDAASGTDTSRMLAAGASRVLWVRTQQGELAPAMPRIRKEIAAAGNVLIESNSVLRFLRPGLFVTVLDPSNPDFKPSALRYLDRADAIFVPSGTPLDGPAWTGVARTLYAGKPAFPLHEHALDPEAVRWLHTSFEDSSIVCRRDGASALR